MVKIINSNKMSTFKDITYKKNDDETWTEWTKRVPDNDEDKLDYIGETIYVKIHENDKKNAGKISDLLLGLGIEDLIHLLENNELLDEKIKEAYEVERYWEELRMSDEEVLIHNEACKLSIKDTNEIDKYSALQPNEENRQEIVTTITVAEMIAALSKLPQDAKLVMTESGFYSRSEFADVMLPELYTVSNNLLQSELPTGTQVYRIGHSEQWY